MQRYVTCSILAINPREPCLRDRHDAQRPVNSFQIPADLAIQFFDIRPLMLVREMAITHRHHDALVPQEFLYATNINSTHHEPGRERVTHVVPPEAL